MNRYPKWMVATSLLLTAAAVVISRLENTDPPAITPEGVSAPLTCFEFDALTLTALAVILAIAAYGFHRRREFNGLETQPRFPKFTFGVFGSLAVFELGLWAILLKVTNDITYHAGGVDFAPIRFWDVWRPLFFSAFWAVLAIGLKRKTDYVSLLTGICGAIAGLSWLMSYRDIYCVYLNYHDFGGEFRFVSYYCLGNWDIVRAGLILIMIGVWTFRSLPKSVR